MPRLFAMAGRSHYASPNYLGLVEFLVTPFLESPDSLSIDCEQANQQRRVRIRLAFETTNKGRVNGRGGRNLQAIRTVLETAAKAAGQTLYLDVYEGESSRPKRTRTPINGLRKTPITSNRKYRPRGAMMSNYLSKPNF